MRNWVLSVKRDLLFAAGGCNVDGAVSYRLQYEDVAKVAAKDAAAWKADTLISGTRA